MGAKFLKAQLEKQAHDYPESVVNCAVDILEQYWKEGHLNHSITYFHSKFKSVLVNAYRTGQVISKGWVTSLQEIGVELGAGRHEEVGVANFYKRAAYLDKHLITTAKEIDEIFGLLDMAIWFQPIITKSVYCKENYNLDQKIKTHVEDPRFTWNDDDTITIRDVALFTQDGLKWYTNSRSKMTTKGGWFPEKPYRLYVDSEGWPVDLKRTATEGKYIRDVFGNKYRIGRTVNNRADPLQPYYELHPVVNNLATPQDTILVSYRTLMNKYDELDEHVKIPYPIFSVWPSDEQEV